jgi:hypothetical protein
MLPILTRLMQRNAAPPVAPTHSSRERSETAGGASMESAKVIPDDIGAALRAVDFRGSNDETLLAYLQLLCREEHAHADEHLRADSRCIRLKAEPMSRHARRISRQTSLLVAVLPADGRPALHPLPQ